MVSGNEFIDKFIQEVQNNDDGQKLVWFPYEKFEDIKVIDIGFSIIYKATWSNEEVILKTLNNTSENLSEFLNEVYHLLFDF